MSVFICVIREVCCMTHVVLGMRCLSRSRVSHDDVALLSCLLCVKELRLVLVAVILCFYSSFVWSVNGNNSY